jgi:hypothetical protein
MSQADAPHAPATGDSLSTAVVSAVADEEGVAPHDLDPVLYDSVDPDALDALFAPCRDGTERSGGEASFVVGEYAVTVSADGTVTLSSDN